MLAFDHTKQDLVTPAGHIKSIKKKTKEIEKNVHMSLCAYVRVQNKKKLFFMKIQIHCQHTTTVSSRKTILSGCCKALKTLSYESMNISHVLNECERLPKLARGFLWPKHSYSQAFVECTLTFWAQDYLSIRDVC